MTAALAGIGVVVTRPAERATALIAGLEACGGSVIALPAIEIRPMAGEAERVALRDAAVQADWLVFISPSAAVVALDELAGTLPGADTRVAAVGAGTARALQDRGWCVDVYPRTGGSAADLLADARFAPLDARVCVIIGGENGRDELSNGLADLGAAVTTLTLYRRALPAVDPTEAIAGWRSGALQYTIVTSRAGLEHLLILVGERGREPLRGSRLITVSARIAERARALGFRREPVIAPRPSDSGLIEALCRAVQESTGSHA